MAVNRPTSPVLTGTTPTNPDITFDSLGVPSELTRALAEQGITTAFPIQVATLPDSLAGRDVLGRGRTGSGKTYAFVLPLLTRLSAGSRSANGRRITAKPGRPRALILAPTRELAIQIDAAMAPLARALSLRTMTIFGGVGAGPQISALRAGVDVVVACPGRLADHIKSGHASLADIEITVLDEADHMADLGFLPEVRRLLDQTPRSGQRLLFSATLDRGVDVLVKRFLTEPVVHSVDSTDATPSTMTHHVLHIRHDDRLAVLVDLTAAPGRSIVFTRTKQRAKRLTRDLIAAGVPAVELHGNLAQTARTRNLTAFADGTSPTLVATDIAARGIHVDDVGLVIHADPPVEHKAYLHRSGRTARAGAEGVVITLMTDDQVSDVRDLTRRAAIKPVTTRLQPGHPLLQSLAPGQRTFVQPPPHAPAAETNNQSRRRPGNTARNNPRSSSTGRRATAPSGRTSATSGRTSSPHRSAGSSATPTRSSGGAASFSASARPRRRSGR